MDQERILPGNLRHVIPRRGATLGILVTAILVVELPHLALFVGLGDWVYSWIFLSFALMSVVPFLLARMAPNAADFDRQWFPKAWLHWGLFLLMVFILLVGGGLSARLAIFLGLGLHRPFFKPVIYDFSLTAVVVNGIIIVLLGPIAEELFWRGYALEQLRKLTHTGIALLVQSLIFAFAHLPLTLGFYFPVSAFFYAIVLGLWRIRFRSLLPLILAHVILNGVFCLPVLKHQYQTTIDAEKCLPPGWATNIRSNPKCQDIRILTGESAGTALPELICFLGDSDEPVRTYASLTIKTYYRNDAEPYLKEALTSRDKRIVDGVLLTLYLGTWRWSGLKEEVRKIVWSADDLHLQISAALTLESIGDVEGLRDIAEKHPEERLRQAAERFLQPRDEPPP